MATVLTSLESSEATAATPTCSACNVTIKGIAPNVNLISFRVLNDQGEGTESQVIQAIQAAIQLKSTYNIRVMNLSVGRLGVRELHARSTLPGGGAGMESWHCGGGLGRQRWTRQFRRHLRLLDDRVAGK